MVRHVAGAALSGMAGPCPPTYAHLAAEVGRFSCSSAHAVINLRNPFQLTSWTQPVIEVIMVAGAALACWDGYRRWRTKGDPTHLALWFAAVLYVLILEPPLYFPGHFGLQKQVGLIFVHNVFTVQFLDDRLPLYIVAVYPAMAYLAYRLVDSLGVFEANGTLVGAACVGFVHQCFYELFDHLGPQLHWWIWNPGAKSNTPTLGAVPLSSLVLFGTVGPAALTLLVRGLIARRWQRGPMTRVSLVARTVLAAVLVPVGLGVGGIPTSLATIGGPHRTADAIVLWAELAAFAGAGFVALARARGSFRSAPEREWYLYSHAALYLGGLAVLWCASLPAYFAAHHGITAQGTPIGSLPYVLVCAAIVVGLLCWSFRSQGGSAGADLHGQSTHRSTTFAYRRS